MQRTTTIFLLAALAMILLAMPQNEARSATGTLRGACSKQHRPAGQSWTKCVKKYKARKFNKLVRDCQRTGIQRASRRVCVALSQAAISARRPAWAKSRDLHSILRHESGKNPRAVNRSSGACGLFQRLPCPWGSVGAHNARVQAANGIRYIKQRYRTPSRAESFRRRNNWY